MDIDDFERIFREVARFGPHTIRSPIRYEVWRDFALQPGERQDLLLEAKDDANCTEVAGTVLDALESAGISTTVAEPAIADDLVAVRVKFVEFLLTIVPLTDWAQHIADIVRMGPAELTGHLVAALDGDNPTGAPVGGGFDSIDRTEQFRWFILLVARIGRQTSAGLLQGEAAHRSTKVHAQGMARWLDRTFQEAYRSTVLPILSVSVNRAARTSVIRSRTTIKADAAARVFDIDATGVGWAVIDSGINAAHLAFRRTDPATGEPYEVAFEETKTGWKNRTRVERTYNLVDVRSRLRITDRAELFSLDVGERLDRPEVQIPPSKYQPPEDVHGTHVAGILAGDWRRVKDPADPTAWIANPAPIIGICPTVNLWDFRVLGKDGRGDEFSVLTALNHIARINAEKGRLVIAGVNLSLSIPHDVANYACGWTPVCEAVDRLVDSGVVVVAAAGNAGFRSGAGRKLADGTNYVGVSITDPGNADKAITVGATHRDLPYRYGVSYFSSRGPTADGRKKPDLLAPGEGIVGPVGEGEYLTLDGTSQAAPHVSGAAALLLARYPELVGRPQRVKEILCASASDLGRDPAFQGHGLVDILRALQAI